MTSSHPDYSDLKEKALAATPGKWKADDHMDWHHPQTDVRSEDGKPVVRFVKGEAQFWCTRGKAEREWANAAFIAAANPSTILSLLEERDRLRADVERLRGTLSYIAAQSEQNYAGVLSVIWCNAKAALNDEFQEAKRVAFAALKGDRE